MYIDVDMAMSSQNLLHVKMSGSDLMYINLGFQGRVANTREPTN
jgi:hypothetical protein